VFHVKQGSERLRPDLAAGLELLGLSAGPQAQDQLLGHLELLERWNGHYNLVGPGSPLSWLRRHTLDSLAISRWVPEGGAVVDVGSGGGFPGLPIAVLYPKVSVTLVEPRANRAAFLQNAVAQLGVKNATVARRSAGAISERYGLVAGRAVAEPEVWGTLARPLCADGGGFVLFANEPPARLLAGVEQVDAASYWIPGEIERWVALYVPRGTSLLDGSAPGV